MSAPGAGASAGLPLAGRTALVTGASRGIGRAVAETLAAAGATVHLLARTPSALHEAASAIPGSVPHTTDLLDASLLEATLAAVAARTGGAPDIVINNAGLFPLAPVAATRAEDFERTIATNLTAPFRVVRAFLTAMSARGEGHIVTIGSVADRAIFPGNGAYSASKYGQRALHEVVRAETRGTGVRATLISPAATDTPIWDPVDPDNTPGFPKRAEMMRAVDVADAVLWAVTRPAPVNVDELRISAS